MRGFFFGEKCTWMHHRFKKFRWTSLTGSQENSLLLKYNVYKTEDAPAPEQQFPLTSDTNVPWNTRTKASGISVWSWKLRPTQTSCSDFCHHLQFNLKSSLFVVFCCFSFLFYLHYCLTACCWLDAVLEHSAWDRSWSLSWTNPPLERGRQAGLPGIFPWASVPATARAPERLDNSGWSFAGER